MTSSITFCNPGEIDVRLITTLGVNVKDCDSPIGYFGTGLKYAIAVALREAQEIVVWSGLQRIDFRVVPGEIRGKEFGFIEWQQEGALHAHRMGFTTDLGKNWTLANAYRELHSNSLDESGREGTSDDIAPQEGYTTIIVTGDAFAAVHRARYDFLLDPLRTKFASNGHVEVYAGECEHIFYRGIAACKLAKPAAFLYNILDTCELTEDRTLSGGSYLCDYKIGEFLATAAPRHVMERAFLHKDGYEEHCEFAFVTPSDECLDVLGDLIERDFERVLDKPKSMYYKKRPKPRQRVARHIVRMAIAATRKRRALARFHRLRTRLLSSRRLRVARRPRARVRRRREDLPHPRLFRARRPAAPCASRRVRAPAEQGPRLHATDAECALRGDHPTRRGASQGPRSGPVSELYLILHKVRGEPAFDIAQKLQIGEVVGWIIPTSGHRATPYKWWPLTDLERDIGQGYWDSVSFKLPADWPDHYAVRVVEVPRLRSNSPSSTSLADLGLE